MLSGVYGVVTLGAIVYFVRHASGFDASIFGFVKGLLWPGVLMYKLLEHFKV